MKPIRIARKILMPKDTPLPDSEAQIEKIDCDVCVIGAGAGGLAFAAGAAAFGKRVVLVEKHKMGGDNLNYASVPSKALLAAAKRAHNMRTATPFGVRGVEPIVDLAAVQNHVKSVIAEMAPNASLERFSGLGVRVIAATARFVGKSLVAAGDYRIKARRFVIATGSSPIIPAIPGLADVAYFTNETIFDNANPLPHLIVIGAGATGLEIAQAYRRLGSRVTVIDGAKALANEDSELAAVALTRLTNEGIAIREGARVTGISDTSGKVNCEIETGGAVETIEGTHLFIAAGRRPAVSELGLEAAGITVARGTIKTNKDLRTRNRRVFVIGDAAGGSQYAHVAEDHAACVLRTILFRRSSGAKDRAAPRIVLTDPELARVGLSETEARAAHGKIKVLRWPYHEAVRAQAECCRDGHVKVITAKNGLILGAGIVGAQAAEIIQPWSLAISQGLKIGAMTEWTPPFPTLSEINKRAAFRYYATAPSSRYVRKVIAILAKLG